MRPRMTAAWVCWGLFLAGPACGQQGEPDNVGAQREVQSISVSLKTGWRGKKEVSEIYGPPAGYVIVEHRVDLKKKDGNVNYSVSILPDKFTGITAAEVKSTYARLADAAAKLHLVDYQAKLQLEQQDLLKRFELKSVSSGVITVKASIEGSGELEFVVYAKIANAATNVSLSQIQRLHMNNLELLAANPKRQDLTDVLRSDGVWQDPEPTFCAASSGSDPVPHQVASKSPRPSGGSLPPGCAAILLPFPKPGCSPPIPICPAPIPNCPK